MKAAILAAGDSTRMLPLSANIPKHLLPVAGQPLIYHTLRELRDAGIKETLVITGYREENLRMGIDAYDWSPMRVVYTTQTERKGTAHAASFAERFAGEDEILLMNGDVIVGPGEFSSLIASHAKDGMHLTMSVVYRNDPTAFGVVVVDEKNRVRDLVEKPPKDDIPSHLINAGVYITGPELWKAIKQTKISSRGEYEITDSIKILIKQGKVGVYSIQSWWLDVGRPWDLLSANEMILKNSVRCIEGTVEEGATIQGGVIVEPSATIRSGAYIMGPAYIGPECVVGPNCFIRPYTYLERKVKIGNAVEIKNSIIMRGTNIGHLSYVGDSVIGRHSNFGAGTITANLRHDNQSVRVTVKGERIDSGRRKMGAIVGDNVKTGIGTSIAPGVVIHQGARTGIGVIVERDIPANTLIIAEQPQKSIRLNS